LCYVRDRKGIGHGVLVLPRRAVTYSS
jgi:hypothetical protein